LPSRHQAHFRRPLRAPRGPHRRVSLGHAAIRRFRGQASRQRQDPGAETVMRVALRSPGLLALTLFLGAPVSAQTLRDFDYTRPLRTEHQLRAVVEFAAGRLILGPGSRNKLYGMTLKYDAARLQPIGSSNTATAER